MTEYSNRRKKMRVKDGLIVNKVMGDYVVMASNPDIFKGML